MHLRNPVIAKFALGAALASLACSATTVQAASSEQVSRLDGTDNFLSGESSNYGVGVSESGRYAIFGSSINGTNQGSFVRDIQANRTIKLTGVSSVYGFDRAQQSVLVSRISSGVVSLALFSLNGAPEQLLWSGPASPDGFGVGARLSADGTTLVIGDRVRNRVVSLNVATGALTTLLEPLDDGVSTGPGGISGLSDDGRTVTVTAPVGYTGTYATKVLRDGKLVRTIPGQGLLSPDGNAFAAVPHFSQSDGSPRVLTITRITTGQSKTFPVPAAGSDASLYADPVWTSSSAAKVVMRVGGSLQQVDYSTGTWSSFGGRYTQVGPIARNGRFAEAQVGRHVALVDLTDAELVGGGDAWSPDVYLDTSASTNVCHATAPLYLDRTCSFKRRIKLITPAPWLPAPKRAAVTITANGLQLASGTLLLGQTLAGNLETPGIFSLQTRATVTDFLGRQRTLSWSSRP